jgi:hypothetical protein
MPALPIIAATAAIVYPYVKDAIRVVKLATSEMYTNIHDRANYVMPRLEDGSIAIGRPNHDLRWDTLQVQQHDHGNNIFITQPRLPIAYEDPPQGGGIPHDLGYIPGANPNQP